MIYQMFGISVYRKSELLSLLLLMAFLLELKTILQFLLHACIPNNRQVIHSNLPGDFSFIEFSNDLRQIFFVQIIFRKGNMRNPGLGFVVRGNSGACRRNLLPYVLVKV